MEDKRILLMHISNISGHRSASLAIEEAIKIQSPRTKILSLNAFNYLHPLGERIVNFFYMHTIQKLPFVWGHLYDNPRWVKRTRGIKEAIHQFNLSKLEKLFNDFRPDVIVSTQAFPCGLVADFKRIKNIKLPLVAVLTDFVLHSYWIYDNVDYYIAPCEHVKRELVKKGIKTERIKVFGIPLNLKFIQNLNKFKIRERLDLSSGLFTILIMGGGQGLGPIKKTVKALDDLKFEFQEIVVCGTNKQVYRWLKKRLNKFKKKILLLNYAENIEELMSAADIIITKPGGITCTEALSKGLPMLIISPIPGQEENNALYLINQGAGIKVNTPKELTDILTKLYNHPEKLTEMSDAALKISKPDAAINIAPLILKL